MGSTPQAEGGFFATCGPRGAPSRAKCRARLAWAVTRPRAFPPSCVAQPPARPSRVLPLALPAHHRPEAEALSLREELAQLRELCQQQAAELVEARAQVVGPESQLCRLAELCEQQVGEIETLQAQVAVPQNEVRMLEEVCLKQAAEIRELQRLDEGQESEFMSMQETSAPSVPCVTWGSPRVGSEPRASSEIRGALRVPICLSRHRAHPKEDRGIQGGWGGRSNLGPQMRARGSDSGE